MALKNLLEVGFDAICFEARDYIGGLWKYSNDGGLSVTDRTTIFNSSRYCSAISDFPFAPEVDDFPTAEQILLYLQDYSCHFGLDPRIRLSAQVKSMRRANGKWVLDILETNGTSPTLSEPFDKVIVATGSFGEPKVPKVEGLEHFAGRVMHAIDVHGGDYQQQRVLVVGLHATAQDVVVFLSKQASKVFISHRSGVLMVRSLSRSSALRWK